MHPQKTSITEPRRKPRRKPRKYYNRLKINTGSSPQGVGTGSIYSSRNQGGVFAKGPDLVGNGFKQNRSSSMNRRQSYTDKSTMVLLKPPTPISHTGMGGEEPIKEKDVKTLVAETHTIKVILDEEKVTILIPISDHVSLSPIQETLKRLLSTFKMTGSWTNRQHKSPDECTNVKVDSNGIMQFFITDTERYNTDIHLLLSTLTRIHQTCMLMRMRAQRVHTTDKSNSIVLQCICVDPFEVSWAIQIYLFKMHKMGVSCTVMGVNNTWYIDKQILLSLICLSITRTYIPKENAYYAFKTISTIIVEEWRN
jgi:hypothetical protein